MKEFLTVFRRWSDFAGRSTRREYWMYTLVYFILAVVLGILDGVMLLAVMGYSPSEAQAQLVTLGNAYSLVTLIPTISVGVRRLHDIDKSGWWLLICLTVIGILLIIYWACVASDEGQNRYGSPAT